MLSDIQLLTQKQQLEQVLPLLNELAEFHNTCNADFNGLYPLQPLTENLAEILAGVTAGNYRVWGIFDEQQLIAFCQVSLKKKIGAIDRLVVKKAYRQNGLATKLLQQALTDLKKYQPQRIEITVVKGNQAAQKLYEKFSFKPRTILMTYLEE